MDYENLKNEATRKLIKNFWNWNSERKENRYSGWDRLEDYQNKIRREKAIEYMISIANEIRKNEKSLKVFGKFQNWVEKLAA